MKTNKVTCPRCTYSENLASASKCELCGSSLKSMKSHKPSNTLEDNGATKRVETPQRRFVGFARRYRGIFWSAIAIFTTMAIASSLVVYRGRNRNVAGDLPEKTQEEKEIGPQSFTESKSNSTLAQIEDIPQGIFWYGSSIPFAPLHTPEVLKEIETVLPNFQTRYKEPPAYTKPGSSTSVTMLLDGMVSFAELSRPLKDSEYARARERGVSLQQIPIASDGIVFFAHPSVPVDRLTINQVRRMILGEITNWQQVGGQDLPVVPFVFDPKIAPSTLLLLFEEPELERFSDDAQYVRDYTDAIRKVGATPGGISYASAAIITNQRSVKPLLLARGDSDNYINPFTEQRKINTKALQGGDYPLMRRFFIGVRRDGTIDERAGTAYANIWLSDLGQKLIEQAGFVPIRIPSLD